MRLFGKSSSSSSCRAASTDIPDHLSPLLPIIHRLWQVFWVTSCILTWLLYGSSWGVVARTCSILLSTFLCSCRTYPFSNKYIYIYIYIWIYLNCSWFSNMVWIGLWETSVKKGRWELHKVVAWCFEQILVAIS